MGNGSLTAEARRSQRKAMLKLGAIGPLTTGPQISRGQDEVFTHRKYLQLCAAISVWPQLTSLLLHCQAGSYGDSRRAVTAIYVEEVEEAVGPVTRLRISRARSVAEARFSVPSLP
jgi:hypothetical protein